MAGVAAVHERGELCERGRVTSMAPGGMNLYGEFAPNIAVERRCPHCGGVSQIGPDAELHYVCSICGGARIPFAEGITPSAATVSALKRAETARKSRGAAKGLSVVGGLGIAFAVALFSISALLFSIVSALALGAFLAVPSVAMLLFGSSRSKARAKEIQRLLEEAWASAAGDAYAAGKAPTAAALAQALGVSAARAEELQAMRTVDASLEAADGAPRANVPNDPRFDALERKVRITSEPNKDAEAEAESEAEAEAARERAHHSSKS